MLNEKVKNIMDKINKVDDIEIPEVEDLKLPEFFIDEADSGEIKTLENRRLSTLYKNFEEFEIVNSYKDKEAERLVFKLKSIGFELIDYIEEAFHKYIPDVYLLIDTTLGVTLKPEINQIKSPVGPIRFPEIDKENKEIIDFMGEIFQQIYGDSFGEKLDKIYTDLDIRMMNFQEYTKYVGPQRKAYAICTNSNPSDYQMYFVDGYNRILAMIDLINKTVVIEEDTIEFVIGEYSKLIKSTLRKEDTQKINRYLSTPPCYLFTPIKEFETLSKRVKDFPELKISDSPTIDFNSKSKENQVTIVMENGYEMYSSLKGLVVESEFQMDTDLYLTKIYIKLPDNSTIAVYKATEAKINAPYTEQKIKNTIKNLDKTEKYNKEDIKKILLDSITIHRDFM